MNYYKLNHFFILHKDEFDYLRNQRSTNVKNFLKTHSSKCTNLIMFLQDLSLIPDKNIDIYWWYDMIKRKKLKDLVAIALDYEYMIITKNLKNMSVEDILENYFPVYLLRILNQISEFENIYMIKVENSIKKMYESNKNNPSVSVYFI